MTIKIKVVNVVATATLDHSLNFEDIIKAFPKFALYDHNVYPCVYFKSSDMKGKVSIFSSGKMISIGTKSEIEAKRELIYVANALKGKGIAQLKDFPVIQNIIMTADLKKKIDLQKTFEVLQNIIYEPEQFPGLIYKPQSKNSSVTFLLFSSGKIVCAGAKSEKKARAAIDKLLRNLSYLRKSN